MKDWNGKEIEVGMWVRHAYEPWSAKDTPPSGRGYHNHNFAGAVKVLEIINETCVRINAATRMPVFLGELLEIVPSREHAVTVPYINAINGPYVEPGQKVAHKSAA